MVAAPSRRDRRSTEVRAPGALASASRSSGEVRGCPGSVARPRLGGGSAHVPGGLRRCGERGGGSPAIGVWLTAAIGVLARRVRPLRGRSRRAGRRAVEGLLGRRAVPGASAPAARRRNRAMKPRRCGAAVGREARRRSPRRPRVPAAGAAGSAGWRQLGPGVRLRPVRAAGLGRLRRPRAARRAHGGSARERCGSAGAASPAARP